MGFRLCTPYVWYSSTETNPNTIPPLYESCIPVQKSEVRGLKSVQGQGGTGGTGGQGTCPPVPRLWNVVHYYWYDEGIIEKL